MPVGEIDTEKVFENDIKPAHQGQLKKTSARAFASSLPGATSNFAEARFWSEKFGLGKHGSGNTVSHPRKAKLKTTSAAVIHGLTFGPPAFSHVSPLAVVSGPRVQLYGTSPDSHLHRVLRDHSTGNKEHENIEPDRQVQLSGSLALAAAFRHDGRLLAVALDNGQVRVADATTRATFCTFQSPTKLGIRSVSWFRDGQKILAAGDDAVARIWSVSGDSVSSEKPLVELVGHGDAIRCADTWQASQKTKSKWTNPYLAFTGSYDHTVRIWNVDDNEDSGKERCLAILSHGAPVEALLIMASSNPDVPAWVLSSGGTYVKVWNPVTGVCVCKILSHHRKTITSMVAIPKRNEKLDSVQMRIITGGLDGLIRIHSWSSSSGVLEHVHGVSVHMPITALAFGEPQNRLAIGTVNGIVLIRQKADSIEKKRKIEPRAGTYAFFTRGMNASPSPGDFVPEQARKKRKLHKYDIALKQFRYGEALDEALATRNPRAITGVVEELGRRKGLTAALSNRDEETLEPLLSFTTRHIINQRYTSVLLAIANRLIDIYGGLAGQSEVVDELFRKLKRQVRDEVKSQKRLHLIAGELDALITTLAMSQEGED